jgi:hypothetical protein
MSTRLTMLDLAKKHGSDPVVGLIEEVQNAAPEIATIGARLIPGTEYPALLRTALPGTGFRNANAGHTPTKSTFDRKIVQCFIHGGVLEVDKAVANADPDGPEAVQASEAAGLLENAFQQIGKQLYYGVSNDASGFPGLLAMYDNALEVDATGSTPGTGSSVWALRLNPRDGVSFVLGNNTPLDLGEWMEAIATLADGKKLPVYQNSLTTWVGVHAASKHAAGRIRDLTADSNKTLTDALIAELVSKFPVGKKPDALFMSRRSALQLQKSRTVTIQTGAGQKAIGVESPIGPMPTESQGLPIIVTDSIVDTETLT